MFLGYGSVLLVILCSLGGAYGDEEWIYWNVNKDELVTHQPLDRSKVNLNIFTAVSMENFDRRLDVGRLKTMLPKVTTLQLRQCDVALINAAFEGKTMLNIRRLWIVSNDGARGCLNVGVAPEFSVANSLPRLEEFAVSRHQFTTIPRRFVPSATLKALRINFAGLERLPGNFSVDYRALETISLQHNNFESFDLDTFKASVQLREVHLGWNRLSTLPEQIFQHNIKLRTLEMGDNKIRTLPERLLSNQRDLEIFDADRNWISAIPAQFFANNLKLRRVNFSWNQLKRLSPKLFAGLSELRYGRFDGNQLKSLGAGLFKDSGKLMEVIFLDNRIGKIAPDAFHKAAPLERCWFFGNACFRPDVRQSSPVHYSVVISASDCIANWNKTTEKLASGKSILVLSFPFRFHRQSRKSSSSGTPTAPENLIIRRAKFFFARAASGWAPIKAISILLIDSFSYSDKKSCAKQEVGETAPRGSYPWTAALKYKGEFHCGSSLSE